MTMFDLHPIDPYEARYKVIATLVLLSELGVIEYRGTSSASPKPSRPLRSLPPRRSVRGGSRPVRPPRSC
jgi:hypothetical protein